MKTIPWNKGISTKLIKRICLHCGTDFKEFSSDILAGNGKFCSRNCWKKGHKVWNKGVKGINAGEKSSGWKGGKPKCLDCSTKITRYTKYKKCMKCLSNTDWYKKTLSKQFPLLKGKDNPNWKGGITNKDKMQRVKFRKTIQKEILKRDNYTCILCGSKKDLQVDHIQSWAEYIELRFKMENCRTLCATCHYKITFGKPMPKNIKAWGHNMLKGGY